jgi:uncharacterized protein (DUF58 family)
MATASFEKARYRAAEIAERVPPLLLAARRIAATIEQGVHGRRRVGRGEAFWQFRQYYPGDELRRLDWRQSAKSDRLFLRQMEWSAAQTAFLWCDLSASMRFSSRRDLPSKLETAQVLTLALAGAMSRAGERVALLGAGERPSAGRFVLEAIAHRLAHLAGQAEQSTEQKYSIPPPADLPAHAHVILVSDFLAPVEELKAVINRFAGTDCRGHLIQVLDPAELDLPYNGRVRFEGVEGEGDLLMSRAENIREDYRTELANHWDGLKLLAQSAGWSLSRHVSDQSAAKSLLEAYQWLSADHRLTAQR